MMTYGDSPMAAESEPGWREKTIHAMLVLGDNRLTGCDSPAEIYKRPQGFSVLLSLDQAAEADRIFEELAANGTVKMAIQETFRALRFGMLIDRFGTPWMINCSRPT
jgi:PhnB protein